MQAKDSQQVSSKCMQLLFRTQDRLLQGRCPFCGRQKAVLRQPADMPAADMPAADMPAADRWAEPADIVAERKQAEPAADKQVEIAVDRQVESVADKPADLSALEPETAAPCIQEPDQTVL